MKIELKNLGALKQAELSLGDMTILCGSNNTGKTYATYALFGFLDYWHEQFSIDIPDNDINQLFNQGVVHINIADYIKRAPEILAEGCQAYTRLLPDVFAASADKFKESQFIASISIDDIQPVKNYEQRIKAGNAEILVITKTEEYLIVTLLAAGEGKLKIPKNIIEWRIGNALNDIIFGSLFPNPFIASAERTGAAIFRKELNFARNRLLEDMSQDKNADPRELLFRVYQDYAQPVKKNVDFTRQLETLAKNNSFIKNEYPEILADFSDIIGGEYTVNSNDELYYTPKGKKIKLTMDESSSAVRSLLDVGFYLKHIAKKGDLLMIDEPELNLHPENQRRVARLLARLVNLGIKVFITTHSDYIVKELNTLIMLNHDKPHLKEIIEQEGYKQEELISPSQIKVYIAEKALVQLDGGKRKTSCQTLTLADIDSELGIEARSFDSTIEDMNRIQEAIVWGAE
jgi:ABC-type lipopolysaccharide export system ATPase subunit